MKNEFISDNSIMKTHGITGFQSVEKKSTDKMSVPPNKTGITGVGSTGFGSTGFQPVEKFQIYKRNLPHWQAPGSVYFISFRTFKNIELSEAARDIVFNAILFWKGKKFSLYGAIIMPDHAHLIIQPLEKKNTDKMSVPPNKTNDTSLMDRQNVCSTGGSTGILPVDKPVVSFYSLAEILHSIKSYSANKINKLFGKSGTLWQDEYFDRIVRDESELLEKMNYIINNPVKAGLVNNSVGYKWLYLMGMKEDNIQL